MLSFIDCENVSYMRNSPSQVHRIPSTGGAPAQRNSTLRLANDEVNALKAVVQFAKANSFNKVAVTLCCFSVIYLFILYSINK